MATVHPFRAAIERGDLDAAAALLHDDVVFTSPAVYAPYEGKDATLTVLRHVLGVLQDFHYVDELAEGNRAALFFRATVGDRQVEGIDWLVTDDDGRIVSLKVLIRPLSGLLAVAEAMRARLA
jgi:ketosteroid isomerase-like protein